jgi:hypothetical protein
MLFFERPVTTFALGPNTTLNTLFSKTLNVCFSLHVRDKVSHRNEKQKQIIVLYVLILHSWAEKEKDIVRNDISHSSLQSTFNLFTYTILICFCRSQIFWICHSPTPPPPKKLVCCHYVTIVSAIFLTTENIYFLSSAHNFLLSRDLFPRPHTLFINLTKCISWPNFFIQLCCVL